VRIYLRLAKARDAEVSVVLALPRAEFRTIFYPQTTGEPPDWQRYFAGRINHWAKELVGLVYFVSGHGGWC